MTLELTTDVASLALTHPVVAAYQSMASTDRGVERDQLYPKTHARELYCLTDKDLQSLPAKEKRNPYVHGGTPMKLFKQSDVSCELPALQTRKLTRGLQQLS